QRLQPPAPLAEVAAKPPIVLECAGQPQSLLRLSQVERPAQRLVQVLLLRFEPVQHCLLHLVDHPCRLLGHAPVMREVAGAETPAPPPPAPSRSRPYWRSVSSSR